VTTNSPVNHVGMSVVIEDLPPLMWHAELGRSLPDLWSGAHQRGVQLHDLRDAVLVWSHRYGQRAWLRQLEPPADRSGEDAVLRTIARLDGTPFPSTARLAARWLRGRVPPVQPHRWPEVRLPVRRLFGGHDKVGDLDPARVREALRDSAALGSLETAYCAEVVAVTYAEMGLLPSGRRSSWYDAGRFWSGDDLDLSTGARLGGEIPVLTPERPEGAR
jgi:hypothetical protein